MLRSVFQVHIDKMLSEPTIFLLIHSVQHEVYQVESGEQGRRKVNILRNGQVGIVPATDRIGGSQDAGPSVQSSDNACLGDRYCLLFHDFMQNGPSGFVHLVELVDATDTAV